MPFAPIVPVQPPFVELVADAADTSAGKRRSFEGIQIVFDSSATTGRFTEGTQISLLSGAATVQLSFERSEPSDLTAPARAVVDLLLNASVREQARSLFQDLRPLLREASQGVALPTLRASQADDGSALIEWTFSDRRLGFSIEEDPRESGWYFVSSLDSGGVLASGKFSNMDLGFLVMWAKDHGQKRWP